MGMTDKIGTMHRAPTLRKIEKIGIKRYKINPLVIKIKDKGVSRPP
jgi:hypothetical protein